MKPRPISIAVASIEPSSAEVFFPDAPFRKRRSISNPVMPDISRVLCSVFKMAMIFALRSCGVAGSHIDHPIGKSAFAVLAANRLSMRNFPFFSAY
jgi:hypothetical protein